MFNRKLFVTLTAILNVILLVLMVYEEKEDVNDY